MAQSTMTPTQARLTAADPPAIANPTWIRPWLRAEGAATLAAGLAGFLFLGLPWWAFLLLLIVPDVSMVGYLRGPRLGAIVYNVAHDLATGVVVAGMGLAIGGGPVAAAGALLVANSGRARVGAPA